MADTKSYRIPVEIFRTTHIVVNSRFIITVGYTPSVDEAKAFLAGIRAEMSDASHHVYAYRVGFGNSVIEGMSDDGEPSGTSGPPILAVLRGTDIGDVIVVVTRYFGGTKLGTGGLVRAYSESARLGLTGVKTETKTEKRLLGIEIGYSFYQQVKRLIHAHEGVIEDETFEASVTILVMFELTHVTAFSDALTELTAGRVEAVILSDS